MGRKKKVDPPYWVTGKSGGKAASGRPLPFVQIYADLMQAQAFNSLSAGARWCYFVNDNRGQGKAGIRVYTKNSRTIRDSQKNIGQICSRIGRIGFSEL